MAGVTEAHRSKLLSLDVRCLLGRALGEVKSKDPSLSGFAPFMRAFPAHSTILNEEDQTGDVYVVCEGWLNTSKTLSDGQTQIIDILLPCDVVYPHSADQTRSSVSLNALTDVKLAIIPKPRWQAMVEAKPEFGRIIDLTRAAEMARVSERLLRLGKGTAQTRVAYALLELSVRLRALGETENGTFHIPLTQQDIGDFIGLSSVHVCRTMRRFIRNGIIETSDHTDVRILDVNRLSEIAEIAADQLEREITLAA